MTNAYGYTIVKGCCSCQFNIGSPDFPRHDEKAITVDCEQLGLQTSRAGKENCQYYKMKDWLWTFKPNKLHKGTIKPKEFYDWLHGLTDATYKSLSTATKLNNKGEEVPKYSSMWKAWIEETVEGSMYIRVHPEMR